MNRAVLTFVHALSPLHAGTGQGVGVIDLPIAREKATNLPFLPGSTLKGTLRDECETPIYNSEIANGKSEDDAKKLARQKATNLFGGTSENTDKSGSVIFTDQRLLCLPVRSLFGTFSWVTSPYILERFKRDCENIGSPINGITIPTPETEECVISSANSALKNGDEVYLEDLDLKAIEQDISALTVVLTQKIFPENENNVWQQFFAARFCIVSDNVMNFLADTATEITARNVLNENKTSANLWYEESLPAETILSGMLVEIRKNNGNQFAEVAKLVEKPVQLGGNMTVGRGLCQIRIDLPEVENNANS